MNVKLSVLLFIISINYCTFGPVKLIIDIGNTVAKLVAFEGEDPIEQIKTNNDTLADLPAFASKYNPFFALRQIPPSPSATNTKRHIP